MDKFKAIGGLASAPPSGHPVPSTIALRGFEALNIALWGLTAVLIATAFGNDRNFWMLLLSWTVSFPFSAIADEYALLIRYAPGFRMLFWRTPVMIPFAFGWFFSLPLILLWRSEIIAGFSITEQAGIVFAGFALFGLLVETMSTSQGLYVYRWPSSWMVAGAPWPVFIIDGAVHTLTYLLFSFTASVTAQMTWAGALLTSAAIYNGMFIAFASINWFWITRILGVRPPPSSAAKAVG